MGLYSLTIPLWSGLQSKPCAAPSLRSQWYPLASATRSSRSAVFLIYTEQETTTPVPTQVDALGSYVDLEVLNYYVWTEFEKYPEYRRNTVYYFVGEGMDEMLVLAPPDFPLLKAESPVSLLHLFAMARDWIQV